MPEKETCQGVVGPQGENEGVWATVKEYKRVKRRISLRSIYNYIEQGFFKSEKTSDRKTLVFVKDAQDAAKILYLRELKKDAPKPRNPNRNRIYRLKLVFPSLNPEQFGLYVGIVRNPSLIAERCDRIDFAYDQVIEVDEDAYIKINAKAKEHGMKPKNMMKSVIYQMMLEKLQENVEQLHNNKGVVE